MERSGRRETISTRPKSFPERSSKVGSVRGKSIIVPRIAKGPPACLPRILPLFPFPERRTVLGRRSDSRGWGLAVARRRAAPRCQIGYFQLTLGEVLGEDALGS